MSKNILHHDPLEYRKALLEALALDATADDLDVDDAIRAAHRSGEIAHIAERLNALLERKDGSQ